MPIKKTVQSKGKVYFLFLLFFVFQCLFFYASAASRDYRFTNNNHDTLVIGKVVKIQGEFIEIEPHYFVVSTGDLSGKAQLRPEKILIQKKDWDSGYFGTKKVAVGSSLVAALNKTDKVNEFTISIGGAYLVSGTDWQTMNFELNEVDIEIQRFIHGGILYQESLDPYIRSVHKFDTSVRPKAIVYPANYEKKNLTFEEFTSNYGYTFPLIAVVIIITATTTYILTKKKFKTVVQGTKTLE